MINFLFKSIRQHTFFNASAIISSPIYSHFTETLDVVNVIQSFDQKNSVKFCKHNRKLIDNDNKTYYPSFMGSRWLSIRLESITNIMMRAISTSSAGFVGVALSSIMNITMLKVQGS